MGQLPEHRSVVRGTAPRAINLPFESELPSFAGATAWLNSQPLTPAGVRGTVVLVQFWTFTCINWLRTLPYVRAWAEKYRDQGLMVIGVHTPEFSFEHQIDNIRRAAQEMRIDWPIAVDNDYAVWRDFDNHYWPALYFADARGRIRHHRFGEGEYEQSEMAIQQLLGEAGVAGIGDDLVSIDPRGVEAGADWGSLRSPETYVGFGRAENFDSTRGVKEGEPHVYDIPPGLRLNHWALAGDWTVEEEGALLNKPDGRIAHRFHARDLHLVMGSAEPGKPVRFRVTIDGQSPGAARGTDIDDQGGGTVSGQRMYQLIRQPKPVADRLFEIEFLGAGIRAYVFTFG